MGMDINFDKIHNKVLKYKDYFEDELEELKENKPLKYKKIAPYIKRIKPKWAEIYDDFPAFISVATPLGNIHKAFHIYQWLLDNVESEEDEFAACVVPKSKLEELLKICEKILEHTTIVEPKVYVYDDLNDVVVYKRAFTEDGVDVAKNLLPVPDFEPPYKIEYDSHYINSVETLMVLIYKMLAEINFNTYNVIYYVRY